jgi:uncharacterized membrane protein (DUF4010 family)
MPDAVWIIALLVLALLAILYAAHKFKPETFKLTATVARLFSFTLEMTAARASPGEERADSADGQPGRPPTD